MHRYLLFDSGCSTCTELARTIEDETEGWLTARSLREPAAQELLDRAKPDWRWEPALLEVDGEEVRVYTGVRMRMRLLRGLGPRTAWRVARLVQEAGVPLGGVDLGRRELLRRGGALVAGLAVLGGKPGVQQQGPRKKGPRDSQHHPLRDVEIQESVRLDGEEAEAFRQRALESGDIGHIETDYTFDTDESVVYRHRLADGSHFWAVGFAVSNDGFVLYHLFERPVEWLQSQAVYYQIEGDVEGKGTAHLIAASVNGQGIEVRRSNGLDRATLQSNCDGCQGAQFNFDCEGCAEVNWGCVAGFCGQCAVACIPAGSLYLPCVVACCGVSLFAACCEVWGATCCSCFGA